MNEPEPTAETSRRGEKHPHAEELATSNRTPKPVRSYHLVGLFLVAAFVVQCCWFVYSVPISQLEADQVQRGVALLRHVAPTVDPVSSPLIPLLAVVGILLRLPISPVDLSPFLLDQHRWFIRAPFLLAGVALAISVWYVARRFYGTAGGNVALALLAFSPGIVAHSAMAGPQIFAAWGAFGLIFTALATAHTLYAPREVIFWNWKRIGLLGVSIAYAAGAQWPMLWLLIPAAAFMLWVVPQRRGATLLILLMGVWVAFVLLDAIYFANLPALVAGLRHALLDPQPFSLSLLAPMFLKFFFNAAPAALVALPIVLIAWCVSRRTRYFGNTAPLLIVVVLLAMPLLFPQSGASAILFGSLPFLLLFVAGVFTDLMEGRWQAPAIAVIFALIFAQAAYSIVGLMRMYTRPPGS